MIHDDKFRYDYDLRFVYGSSYVGFIDGRVAGWKSASNRRLNVELHPGQISGDRSHFTVESTIDEVLTVQGPPDAYIGAGKFATKYATNSSVFNLLEFEFGHSTGDVHIGDMSPTWESSSKSPLKVPKYPLTGKLTISIEEIIPNGDESPNHKAMNIKSLIEKHVCRVRTAHQTLKAPEGRKVYRSAKAPCT